MTPVAQQSSIYGAVAPIYLDSGWEGVLPIPAREKGPPPEGFTGAGGAWPDSEAIDRWISAKADWNVILRASETVVGVDVDQYDEKRGADELEAGGLWPPPPTWRSSARDAPSGIYWFRIPAGIRLKGAPFPGVEIVQFHHRYAVAPPSIHRDTGDRYRWFGPDGDHEKRPPQIDELPDLPEHWLAALRDDRAQPERCAPRPPSPVTVDRDRSRAVQDVLDSRHAWAQGSRHDQALRLSMALARLEHSGHPGATAALDEVGDDFIAAKPEAADKEWPDIVASARDLARTTAATRPDYSELVGNGRPVSNGAAVDGFIAAMPSRRSDVNGHDHQVDAICGPTQDDLADRMLPDRFWTARPALEHIRTAAHSRIRSADNVLHGVLCRLAAYTPHTIELPPLAGSAGSGNYFALSIGPSGSGKSSGAAIAEELLPRPANLECPDRPLGSGEGLAENYMGTVIESTEDGGKRNVRRQTIYNCHVYGDEGAALTEMMDRKGATLPEALRRAWTGGALGQANATTERTRVIPAGRYRLGLLIGFQPQVAAKLMADDIAGTPQRFMFASAVDPHIPDELPSWPGRLEVPTIPVGAWIAHEDRSAGYVRHRMGVHPEIAHEVRSDAIARARGLQTDDHLDSHRPLHLLKAAGLLAILDGRLDIDLEDWALAEIIWNTSRRVRAGVVAAVAAEAERIEARRIETHAAREHAAEAARGSARDDVDRLAQRLARWVHEQAEGDHSPEDGHPRRALLHRMASKERHLIDPAISHAITNGWLDETDGRYRPGASRPRT